MKKFFPTIVAIALAASAHAQTTIQWTPAQSGSQNWNATGNWNGANVPNVNTEAAAFGSGGTPANQLTANSTYTITQDIASLNLGGLTVNMGNATNSTFNLSGNDINLSRTGTQNFTLTNIASSTINVASNVQISATGTTTVQFIQGAAATAGSNGVSFTGSLSGSGNITNSGAATLNNASNSHSGTWIPQGGSALTAASNSLGTATYKLTSASSTAVNSQMKFTDSGNFAVSNLIADTGAWSQSLTTSGGSGGLTIVGGVTGTFSNFEVGATAGNGYVQFGRTSGSGNGIFKITDTNWTANANLLFSNASLDLANSSGVQTIGAGLRDNGASATLTRSGVGGTTILGGASNLSTTVTVSGGTLLVNNPTTNVTSLTVNSTTGSRTVTTASTAGLVVGQTLTGGTLGSNQFITSIVDGTTFTLSGIVTTGQTGLSATLSANSGTGTGNVNVTGGTLGGSGLIAPGSTNKITVSSGAIISPGGNGTAETIGTLVIDSGSTTATNVLTMSGTAQFNFQLGTTNSSSDKINFWNATPTDLLRNNTVVNLTLDPSVTSGTYKFTLFNFYSDAGSTLINSSFAGSGSNVLTLIGATLSANIGSAAFNYSTNGQIDLDITAIPEPATWALLAFSLTTVVVLRRRRKIA